MKEMVERVADTLAVSQVAVRAGIVVIAVVVVIALVLIAYKLCRLASQKSDYKFYSEHIPEVESGLSDLELKIVRLERDLGFCQAVIEEKVLAAVKELDLTVLSDEAKWLVETCQKVDTKKMCKKLRKKQREAEECREWLREAREIYTALSEKFGGI